jgi:hypothetical protein
VTARLVVAYYVVVALATAAMIYVVVTMPPSSPSADRCRLLIGGWHPDVSPKEAEWCRRRLSGAPAR